MQTIKLKNSIKNEGLKNKKKFVPIDPNDNIRLYFTMLMCSPRGLGKTNSAINIMKYMQDNKLIVKKGIYIITTTFDNNNFEDYLDLDENNLFTNIHDTQDLNDALNIIDEEVSEKVGKWKEIRNKYILSEYNKLYKHAYKKYMYNEINKNNSDNEEDKLTEEETQLLEDNEYKLKQTYYDTIPSFILLLDDIQGIMCEAKKSPLTQIIIRHRHKHLNIIVLTQTLKNALPKACRANIVYYSMWHFNDEDVIKALYNEIGNSYTKSYEEFYKLYNFATDEKHNFLFIDTLDSNKSLRKNFDEVITLQR